MVAYDPDFRIDGIEVLSSRMKAGTPVAGAVIEWRNCFMDIALDRRIVISQSMSFNGRRVSVALATIELLKTEKGTDMIFTHHGAFFEGADGPQMREMGWKALFDRLGKELDS